MRVMTCPVCGSKSIFKTRPKGLRDTIANRLLSFGIFACVDCWWHGRVRIIASKPSSERLAFRAARATSLSAGSAPASIGNLAGGVLFEGK